MSEEKETGVALFEGVDPSLFDNDGAMASALRDWGELAIDSLVEVASEIPLLSTVTGLLKAAATIPNAVFLRKGLKFLKGAQVSAEERRAFLAKYDHASRRKFGERLVEVIDALDDSDKAVVLGHIHRKVILGELLPERLIELGRLLNSINLQDLRSLHENHATVDGMARIPESQKWRLSNADLLKAPDLSGADTLRWRNSTITEQGLLLTEAFALHAAASADSAT